MNALRSVHRHAVLSAVVCAILWLAYALCPPETQAQPEAGSRAPDFKLTECVNVDSLVLSQYDDSPVLLFFFDAGDIPSANAFPYVSEWYRRYKGDGLKVVGIHCPRYEPLKIPHNAFEVVVRAKIRYPLGLDPDRVICRSYGIQSLPTYVLTRPGREVAFATSEERPYCTVETAVQEVISELKPTTIHPFLVKPFRPIDDAEANLLPASPRLVLGHATGTVAGSDSALVGVFHLYTDSGGRDRGKVYLSGTWKVDSLGLVHDAEKGSPDDYLRLIYSGKDVWLLPGFQYDHPQKIYVKQDRQYLSEEAFGKDIMYDMTSRPYIFMKYSIPVHVVSNASFGAHILELIPAEGNVTLYEFFFETAAR